MHKTWRPVLGCSPLLVFPTHLNGITYIISRLDVYQYQVLVSQWLKLVVHLSKTKVGSAFCNTLLFFTHLSTKIFHACSILMCSLGSLVLALPCWHLNPLGCVWSPLDSPWFSPWNMKFLCLNATFRWLRYTILAFGTGIMPLKSLQFDSFP